MRVRGRAGAWWRGFSRSHATARIRPAFRRLARTRPVRVGRRVALAFTRRTIQDRAAALTYYAVLAIFPALIVLVGLLGVLGQQPETSNVLMAIIDRLGMNGSSGSAAQTLGRIIEDKASAGTALGLGTAAAVFTASAYISSFARSSNRIFDTREGRPYWNHKLQQIGLTFLSLAIVAVTLTGLVVSGPVAAAIGRELGIGDFALHVYSIVKWIVIIAIDGVVLFLLYYVSPNVRQPSLRRVLPGVLAGLALWMGVSAAFSQYVTHWADYGSMYGGFATGIVALIWLWLSNAAILMGQVLNAEMLRSRQIAAGVEGAEDRIRLPHKREPA